MDFERGINSCVNQIRTTLGDDPEKPRYIETVPRRGYRFVASVISEQMAEGAKCVDVYAPELLILPKRSNELALVSRKPRLIAAITAAGVALAVTLGIYTRISRKTQPELTETQITDNSSENTVTSNAISPDGKYLAYSDRKGIHLKLIATGETQT